MIHTREHTRHTMLEILLSRQNLKTYRQTEGKGSGKREKATISLRSQHYTARCDPSPSPFFLRMRMMMVRMCVRVHPYTIANASERNTMLMLFSARTTLFLSTFFLPLATLLALFNDALYTVRLLLPCFLLTQHTIF